MMTILTPKPLNQLLNQPAEAPNLPIHGFTSDSRLVQPGWLFVAYQGVSVDGHRYIHKGVAQGAVAVVGEIPRPIDLPNEVIYLQVADGRAALGHIAAAWFNHPSRAMTVIGVTGTDGKTSTANLIYAILRDAGYHTGMISTVNAVIGDEIMETGLHTTTPDAPDIQRYLHQMHAAGTHYCVLEVTSHGLAHHRVTGVDFDVAVVTNITHEHLDLHGSLRAYQQAKARLFELAGKAAVLNADDDSYSYLPAHVSPNVRQISYGRVSGADLPAENIELTPQATQFQTLLAGQICTVQTPLVGAFNVSNTLAALGATVAALNVPVTAALTALRQFGGVPGRMERIDEGQTFTAIVDFAHTPNALARALQTAQGLTTGRVIAVFGSAGLRDVEKRRMMGTVAAQHADITIITAEDPRTESLAAIIAETAQAMMVGGVSETPWSSGSPPPAVTQTPTFLRCPDRGEALYLATRVARPGDVLIALGKGHEQSMCFGEVEYPWDDRDALRDALRGMPRQTLPTANQRNTPSPPA